jgi:hypothetical protein
VNLAANQKIACSYRNEEGIQINMEDTPSHETVYKLAHRADKANFSSKSDSTILTIVTMPN